MSNNPVAVLVDGMIGILCMQGAVEVIIKLMEIIPEPQTMAYALVTIIAVKLLVLLPPLNSKLPDAIFAGIAFGTAISTVIFRYVRQNLHGKETS